MHRRFHELLRHAHGDSHPVFVVSVDVRSFSRFSLEVESVEAVIYLKKIYERIIADYFPGATFFTPTGDGLLFVFAVVEERLAEQAIELVAASRRLVKDFATLLSDDLLINFEVPERIGIGIARGAASALVAEDVILDYSGKVLNTAVRLTELARPEGAVISSDVRIELLEDAQRKDLMAEDVYVRSIAEDRTMTVYVDPSLTRIPPRNRRPFKDPTWEAVTETRPWGELRALVPTYGIPLPSVPLDHDHVRVELLFPRPGADGSPHSSLNELMTSVPFSLQEISGGRSLAKIDMVTIIDQVRDNGIEDDWPVVLSVHYLPA